MSDQLKFLISMTSAVLSNIAAGMGMALHSGLFIIPLLVGSFCMGVCLHMYLPRKP